MMQSDANQSPRSNSPDHQGKYREFHDLETVKADGMVENPSFHQVLSKEFPRSQNREFKIRNRGTFEKDQGLKGDLQGNVAPSRAKRSTGRAVLGVFQIGSTSRPS